MNAAQWDVEHARRYGEEIGLILGAQAWRNAELHEQACRLARALVDLGVEPGDRVALILPNSRELYVGCSAAMMAGGVVVVLPAVSEPELAAMLAHCEPAAVISPAPLPVLQTGAGSPCRIVTADSPGRDAGTLDFDELIRSASRLERPVERSESDPAQLCFTSGATGRPKAVVYTHGGVDLFWRARAAAGGEPDHRRVVLIGIPPTAFGSRFIGMRSIANYLYVLCSPFDPLHALEAIERYRVTEMPLVPTMAEQLAACTHARSLDCSSLRAINIAGAHVSSALIEKLKTRFGGDDLSVLVHYGMTETGGGFASTTRGGDGAVGRVTPGTLVRILDRDGQDVPSGTSGEVVVRPPFAAAGYWRDPEQTAAVFRDGFVHTGDLGSLSSENDLSILGRIKDIIIQGGLNVLPNEVASIIATLPGVLECAVVGLPNELLGEEVVACVVRSPGASLTEAHVRAHCRDRLDARKQPVSVVFCEDFPRTSNAKVSARLLREQLLDARSRVATAPSPLRATDAVRLAQIRAEVERELESLLSEIPGRPAQEASALRTRTYGELGLGSIGVVRLTHRLNALFGLRLSPTILYSNPTVESLSQTILNAHERTEPASAPAPEALSSTAIAISGVGCRLPGGVSSADDFWDLLLAGRDTVRDAPTVRRSSYKAGAMASFVENAEAFDAAFFGLQSLAAEMDARHRMVLEVAWEALEDAGCNPLTLDRERTGVFLGVYGDRYPGPNRLAAAPGMAVSFLCQFLDLRGPVVSVDTTCSSSLVAIHDAVQSLRHGECDIAIAGGVSLLTPEVLENSLGVVSPDGHTRAFDSSANGFGAGEGCVLLVLRRWPDAQQSGDRAHAVLLGTAINHDGRSSSLTAPNPCAQERVISLALQRSGLAADRVQYVEAHGTGTILGDPIEVEALSHVFAGRTRAPLAIGSVKTNIGHLEAAAGAAGVAKMALAISRRYLPASLGFSNPNPHIEWDRIPVRVQSRAGAWPTTTEPLIAGISSFGMSGTNAHVVLSEPPRSEEPRDNEANALAAAENAWLLPLSAASATSLRGLAERWADFLERERNELTCRDLAYTASCRRAHLGYRIAVAGRTRAEWITALRQAARSGDGVTLRPSRAPHRDLVMVFSGQGPQWWAMGRELHRSQPVFREALERCAVLIDARLSIRLLDEFQCDEAQSRLSRTEIAQPALFALQVALYELWRSWGVEPTAVLGHSLGEVAAAHVAGVLTLDQAVHLVCARAEASKRASRDGAMVSVALTAQDALGVCRDHGGTLSVAARNSPRSCVLAGDAIEVTRVLESLRARGIDCVPLRGEYAFHSAHMNVAAQELSDALTSWTPGIARRQLVSSLTADDAATLDASYWGRQLREPVRFFEASRLLLERGQRVFLEMGPHPVLAPALLATAESLGLADEVTVGSSLRRGCSDSDSLLAALSALHCSGFTVDWSRRYAVRGRMARPPGIVWQHRAYWHTAETVDSASVIPTNALPSTADPGATAGTRFLHWLAEAAQVPVSSIRDEATLDSLGLDSLAIIRLRSKVTAAMGARERAFSWKGHATIGHLRALLEGVDDAAGDSAGPPTDSPLVWLQRSHNEPAIVWIHPVGGGVSCYRNIAAELPFTSAAIEAPGLNHVRSAARSVEEMAHEYLDALRQEGDFRPRILAGWSFGGVVAYEMAHQRSCAGRPADLVVLIDSYLGAAPPGQSALALFVWDLFANSGGVGSRLGDLPADYLDRMLQVFTENCEALGRYRPPRYAGDVLSLRASNAIGDPDAAWRAVAPQLQAHQIEGDHHSILSAPGRHELIRLLHAAIAACSPQRADQERRSFSAAS